MTGEDAFTWVNRGRTDMREQMLGYADALANWDSPEARAFLASHPGLTVGEYVTAQAAIRAAVAASFTPRLEGGVDAPSDPRLRLDSWTALHMTSPPGFLDDFIYGLPMGQYREIREWLDRVIRVCYEDAERSWRAR